MKTETAQLLELWTAAFGEREFWVTFLEKTFSPDHCCCLELDGVLAAALYWFDCSWKGQRLAYLYAVATGEKYRHRGLCRTLMADTEHHLQSLGYQGMLLVPGDEGLRRMYEKLGYETCSTVSEVTCTAAETPVEIHQVEAQEYARLRRSCLPDGGVVQEGENLKHLQTMAGLYAGEGFVLAAYAEGKTLHGLEFLGEERMLPAVVRAMDCTTGTFRMPGGERAFAMFRKIGEMQGFPNYFGLAFD